MEYEEAESVNWDSDSERDLASSEDSNEQPEQPESSESMDLQIGEDLNDLDTSFRDTLGAGLDCS